MTVEQLVELFREKPYLPIMGAGKLSKRLHCSKSDIYEARRIFRQGKPRKMPKVLIFDTETAPMSAYVWGLWKENIAWDHVQTQWFFLCWSAKWLYSTECESDCLTPEEAIAQDDSRITRHLWELVNEADIVVAHNGRRADIPWMNTRFIMNGLTPPSPYKVVDTLEVAKRTFGFSSNKLDALAGYFGFPHKLKTTFELWESCYKGDAEALQKMLEYNVMDTCILEDVYLKLRPWIASHPNMNNLSDSEEMTCCKCNSLDLVEIPGKYYYTTTQKYKVYRCKECGAITRSRFPEPREATRAVAINI